MRTPTVLPMCGFALAISLAVATASAADFTVTSNIDVIPAGDSNPGDGVCEDERSGVRCTLRAAIEEANALAGGDRILFGVAGTIAIIGTPLPAITGPTVISGKGAPGYVQGSSLANTPPVVYLSGTLLGATADGLRFRNANATPSFVSAIGLIHFGGTAISSTVDADELHIDGCYIGVEDDGTAAGNGNGVFLVGDDNQIGRRGPPGGSGGLGNVVSASAGDAITVVGSGNLIRANKIGTTATGGAIDRGNGGHGILVIGEQNLLGDSPQGDGNVLMFNGGDGVRLHGADNVVANNGIHGNAGDGVQVGGSGNQVAGNAASGNGGDGIDLRADTDATLVVDNLVGRNGAVGIRVEGMGAMVCGNRIGTTEVYADRGNHTAGVHLIGNDAIVGHGPECAGNLIGFNSAGIDVHGNGNIIAGNRIGGDASGGIDFGNLTVGIVLEDGASDNEMVENSIAANPFGGVVVEDTAGNGNDIVFNQFRGNGMAGIDLLGDGVTMNDPGDADSGPNMLQNTPVLLDAVLEGGILEVSYRVDSTAIESAYPLRIELQLGDGSIHRQGIRTLGFDSYATPGAVAVMDVATPLQGGLLLAIATDSMGNSSEFSPIIAFGVPDLLFADGFEDPAP